MNAVVSRSVALLVALASVLSAVPSQSRAAIPQRITYQGYLTNSANAPVTGTLSMIFRLWDLPLGGNALHTEPQTVAVSGGIFNVMIGSTVPLALPFDVPYYLGVTVEADAEMTPRQPVTATPYAMRAAAVDATAALPAAQITGTVTISQLADGGYVRNTTSPQLNSNFNIDGNGVIGGTLGIGTANPGSKLTVAGVIETTSGGIKFPDGSTQTSAAIPPALDLVPVNTVTTIDSAAEVGRYSAITIGLDRAPVISYFDSTNHSLKVAKCANVACTGASTITTVDSTGTVGVWSSITIGADGFPVISYWDATNFALKVAKCGNPACTGASTITTVDNTDGEFTSITLGVDGFPVISYHGGNQDLKVAKCANAACTSATLTTVDSAASAVKWTSITLGWDGNPVIAYLAGFTVKVAKCANADCSAVTTLKTIETPAFDDPPSPNEPLTSIAIGPDAIPIVSYYDVTGPSHNGRLRVAKCADVNCTGAPIITTVDASSDVGYHGSIAIGADGLPVISYHDNASANRNLKVAKCTNATCTGVVIFTVLDSIGVVGQYTSITIGTDGLPVMSYYDLTNRDLKVAKCGSASCGPILRRR